MEKNVESDPNPPLASGPEFPPATTPADVKNDVALEKSVVPPPEVKADESKALAVVESKRSLCIYSFSFSQRIGGKFKYFLGKLISRLL